MKLTYSKTTDTLCIQFRGSNDIADQSIECANGIVVGLCEQGCLVDITVQGAKESTADLDSVELEEIFS